MTTILSLSPPFMKDLFKTKPYINGKSADSPVKAGVVVFTTGVGVAGDTVLTLLRFTFGCVPPNAESKGKNRAAVGGRAGNKPVGARAVVGGNTGTTGAVGVKGRTVTWITESAGLNNMVTVALACLTIGLGGTAAGKAMPGARPSGNNGRIDNIDGNTEKAPK